MQDLTPLLLLLATVRIAVDTDGPSTRVVLTTSRPVEARVDASKGRIEIVYAEPVEVAPAESRLDDALLAGWRLAGDRTLVLATGPGYRRHESFDLRNPPRLVLDLQGERPSGKAARPRDGGAAPAPTVVVIDPGHGGVETGALGPGGLQEKDVTLDLARRLKAVLERDRSYSVVLTRDGDRLVALDERTAVANHNRADLFLSIHLNASRRADAFGAETYFLSSEATDDEARKLAALENRAYEAGGAANPPTAAADRGLELVLWDLAQNQYLAESGRLAETVQKEMNALAGTRDRGVRQAPFTVLMGATMPAILAEVGFISNPEEARRFLASEYRDRLVEALARAVEEFRQGRMRLDAPAPSPAAAGGPR